MKQYEEQREKSIIEKPGPEMKSQISPRPYLSWSQIQLFERSPELYLRKYISGKDEPDTEAMRLGKNLAQALEIQEKTGDQALDNLLTVFPVYPQREFKIEALLEGMEVPLYGILDGFDEKQLRIGEYKSGRFWDQKMVDESGQLKMYALMVWLKYQKMPSEVMLHWAKTEYNETDGLVFTGEIYNFVADISVKDLLLFTERILRIWEGIKNVYKERQALSPR